MIMRSRFNSVMVIICPLFLLCRPHILLGGSLGEPIVLVPECRYHNLVGVAEPLGAGALVQFSYFYFTSRFFFSFSLLPYTRNLARGRTQADRQGLCVAYNKLPIHSDSLYRTVPWTINQLRSIWVLFCRRLLDCCQTFGS